MGKTRRNAFAAGSTSTESRCAGSDAGNNQPSHLHCINDDAADAFARELKTELSRLLMCLQCFDAVGWAAKRAFGL